MEINIHLREYSHPDNQQLFCELFLTLHFSHDFTKTSAWGKKRGRIWLQDSLLYTEIILQLLFVTK